MSLGCQEDCQEHPYPPSPSWILGGQMIPDTHFVARLFPLMCYASNFMSLGCQEPCQEHPYPPSPSWILGGQMVPDAHSVARLCPGGVMFQISCLRKKFGKKFGNSEK